MKSKAPILVILVSLALICCSVSASAAPPTPDGFDGIPWGANREQIIKTMDERGFTTKGTIRWEGMPPSTLLFRGAFDGVSCQLEFVSMNNALYAGSATQLGLFSPPGHLEEIYRRMVSQLSKKYGPPQSDKKDEYKNDEGEILERGWGATWEIIDKESSDKYAIDVSLIMPGSAYYSNAPNPDKPEPSVTVSYSAVSLLERLKTKEF